jgi:hypothetical protein
MFGWFRRKPKIATCEALVEFIDAQAAFVIQKGIYEYSRARAGHYSKVLFRESGFIAAVETSRWKAFPIGLAMVAEVADSALRRTAPGMEGATAAVIDATLKVFDRYPVPPSLGEVEWQAARQELSVRLAHLTMHAPKRAYDVSEPYAQTYFDLMPIYEKLRRPDFPTLRNYLRVQLCNVYDELTERLDIAALSADIAKNLAQSPASPEPPSQAAVNVSN